MGWFFSSAPEDDAEYTGGEEYVEEQAGEAGEGEAAGEDAGGDDGERGATIVDWAQRLMITKGYGWSKAVSVARDLYGDE